MAVFSSPISKPASWPMSVGAEGIAAAQFARCGFDVLVQAGRDKPWYDLVVTKAGNLLKVSVKASDNGEWALTNGFVRRVAETNGMRIDCLSAIDMWRAGYGSRTVVCLVQFEGAAIHELPRVYLASPEEIAANMREVVARTGRCTLLEMYEWTAANGQRVVEMLPEKWHFSQDRVQEMLLGQGNSSAVPSARPKPVIAMPAPATASAPGPRLVIDPAAELALSV
ncbi:PDDEXK-like family protein [Occallatibacter riparius]|uniref:Uncharacterized protein n=1 Tax=Occallatibacter riparius TaxID=1002689 RepID=A0A9J7BW06_9BACT|nr:hypothetical protein [Occallatibacter riparius]UWZ85978.1 hypothetical protein MOP44_08535 [Occallatibacter riparius]